MLYLDHLTQRGRDLLQVACKRDLEGIVGKWIHATYQTDERSTSWVKMKNPTYSQIVDRHELFERGVQRTQRTAVRPELRLV